MGKTPGLLLSFYGDDFTGSTDVMEALMVNGIPTALFLAPPDVDTVRQFRLQQNMSQAGDGSLRAFGVAGTGRSMTPEQMQKELPPIFRSITAHSAPIFHYKTCSTFDSSPSVGSIGKASELAREITGTRRIPLLVGTPCLKRFVAFGNLFASVGSETYRIDRHPTMSRHPVTPMDEGDIRLHLARQTRLPVHLFDLLQQQGPDEVVDARYEETAGGREGFVLFDCLEDEHLRTAGRLVWENRGGSPVFVAGASAVEYALCEWWLETGETSRPAAPPAPGPVDRLLVMSGSCAPVTRQQIDWGLENGFHGLGINTAALVHPDTRDREFDRVVSEAASMLKQDRDVIVYSARGPDDPMIDSTRKALDAIGEGSRSPSQILGREQGLMLKEILGRVPLKRVMVTGGDTSGHVTGQLGIFALEATMPLAPGSPLCVSHADTDAFDGLEIVLKGGQVGKVEYFGQARAGENPEYIEQLYGSRT